MILDETRVIKNTHDWPKTSAEKDKIETALKLCNTDASPFLVGVQDFGALVVIRKSSGLIVQASLNIEQQLGIELDRVLGQKLDSLFTCELTLDVNKILKSQEKSECFRLNCVSKFGAGEFDLHFFTASENFDCVEILNSRPERKRIVLQKRLEMQREVSTCENFISLQQTALRHMTELVDATRFLFYSFQEDFHGVVTAEITNNGDPLKYLHHHFLESDIPATTRAVYLKNPVRTIHDIYAIQHSMVGMQLNESLDLSSCFVRKCAAPHIQYLKNMGQIRSCLSLAVLENGRLKGLVSCHSHKLILPSLEVLAELQNFSQVLSEKASSLAQGKVHEALSNRSQHFEFLRQAHVLQQDTAAIMDFMSKGLNQSMNSSGVVAFIDGKNYQAGNFSPGFSLENMIDFVQGLEFTEYWQTRNLSAHCPSFASLGASESGCLVVGLPNGAQGDFLAWIRVEEPEELQWVGKLVFVPKEDDFDAPLNPSRSFEKWTEYARHRSKTWSEEDIRVALHFRTEFLMYRVSNLACLKSLEDGRSEAVSLMLHDLGNALCGVVGRVHELSRTSNEMRKSRVKDVFRLIRNKGDDLSLLFPEGQKDALLQVLQSTEAHFDSLSRTLAETTEKLQRGVANCNELLESNRSLVKSKVEMKLKNFSLKNAVSEAIELIPDSFTIAGLKLDASKVESHFRMLGERQVVLRVVLNLLKNAAEAGKHKTDSPHIQLWTEDFWTFCVLHILDDGKGISAEQMSQIFKKGYTTKEGGSGLGLHGCRKMIRQIGGDLSIFSKGEGTGTEVCLKLPVISSRTAQKESNYEQMEQ